MSAAWKLLGLRGSIALVLAALLSVVLWRADAISGDRDRWKGAARILAGRVLDERQAHQGTKDGYRAAQAEAARLEQARLARVKAEQQEITDDIVADYRRRLADARARAERLRIEATRARERPAGSPDRERVPAAGDAAGRTDGAATHRGLPLAPLTAEQRLIATEQAIQLDALISWVERQAMVEPNR